MTAPGAEAGHERGAVPGQGAAPHGGTRVAVLDLGTNSIKYHLAERGPDGRWQTLADRAEVTRLGDGLARTGELSAAARERTCATVCAMAEQARAAGAAQILAVGTMGLRTARNSPAFIAELWARCGVKVEVIDAMQEARLAWLAVQEAVGLPDGTVTVFDTGGGSTQVTVGQGRQVLERLSLDLGAVRITEQYGLACPVGPAVLETARAGIGRECARLAALPAPEVVVGLGGAVANLTAVSLGLDRYDPRRIQGAVLTRVELQRQCLLYAGLDGAGRAAIPGVQPGRADIILAGALIVWTLLGTFGQDRLLVTDRGVRHGVLLECVPDPE